MRVVKASSSRKEAAGKTRFQCRTVGCTNTFATSNHRNRHEDTAKHAQDYVNLPFPCREPGCFKAFKDKQQLGNHQQYHKNGKQLTCPLPGCDFAGNTKNAIETHIQSPTSHVKPIGTHLWRCSVRGKELQTHSCDHQGTELHLWTFPCRCDGCGRRFTDLESMEEHFESHDKEPPKLEPTQKPGQERCPICVGTIFFDTTIDLVAHMKGNHPIEHTSNVYTVPLKFLRSIIPKFRFGRHGQLDTDMDIDSEDEDDRGEDHDGIVGGSLVPYTPELMAWISARNDAFLRHYSSTYSGLQAVPEVVITGNQCTGPTGLLSCAFHVTTSYQVCYLVGNRHSTLRNMALCVLCARVSNHLQDEQRHEKFTRYGLCMHSLECQEDALAPKKYCEKHAEIRTLQYERARLSKATKIKRTGLGSSINTNTELRKHLQKKGLILPAPYKAIYDSLRMNPEKVFYIDTEHVGDLTMEICVLDSRGNAIVDTVVDHGCSVRAIWEQCSDTMFEHKLLKIYGKPSEKRSGGMTALDIKKLLV